MCERTDRQTDIQTYREADFNTSHCYKRIVTIEFICAVQKTLTYVCIYMYVCTGSKATTS